MKNDYRKYAVLVLSAAAFKMIFIEIAFTLNFSGFSYHGLFGPQAGNVVLSLGLCLVVHILFYTLFLVILSLSKTRREFQPVFFIEGLVINMIEMATYNFRSQPLIADSAGILTLLLVNIIIVYTLNISYVCYQKE